jgi:hypothetical protein
MVDSVVFLGLGNPCQWGDSGTVVTARCRMRALLTVGTDLSRPSA